MAISQGKKIGRVTFQFIKGTHIDEQTIRLREYPRMTKSDINELFDYAIEDINQDLTSPIAMDESRKQKLEAVLSVLGTMQGKADVLKYLSVYGGRSWTGRKWLYVIVGGEYFLNLCFAKAGSVVKTRRLNVIGIRYTSKHKYGLVNIGKNVRINFFIPLLWPNCMEVSELEATYSSEEREALMKVATVIDTAMVHLKEAKYVRQLAKDLQKKLNDAEETISRLTLVADEANRGAASKSLFDLPGQGAGGEGPKKPQKLVSFITAILAVGLLQTVMIAFVPNIQVLMAVWVGIGIGLPVYYFLHDRYG